MHSKLRLRFQRSLALTTSTRGVVGLGSGDSERCFGVWRFRFEQTLGVSRNEDRSGSVFPLLISFRTNRNGADHVVAEEQQPDLFANCQFISSASAASEAGGIIFQRVRGPL